MIKTRIAPSPTGMLHLGTARTALFAWAFARRHGGQFVLRIEDTDLERSTEVAVKAIIDSLHWLNLDYDEGPIRQTDRLDRYREIVDRLLSSGLAYHCYASKEELDQLRADQTARGEKPRYDGRWRPERAQGLVPPANVKPVVRLKTPLEGEVSWNDLVKGPITIRNSELDDMILVRSDGIPTYNFAVVVDDIDMNITHVLRGDDHVNNTPRQIHVYRAILGDNTSLPHFGHLPMILGPDGQKLSKRHGAVSVMQFDDDGILPEALFNYLGRLGWSHGDDEVFSREQFTSWFDVENISRSAAQYDPAKLLWLNGEYIKKLDGETLAKRVMSRLVARLKEKGASVTNSEIEQRLPRVMELMKSRATQLNELADASLYFFSTPNLDLSLVQTHWVEAILPALRSFVEKAQSTEWNAAAINALFKQVLAEFGLKMPQLAIPLRVAVAGTPQTPSVDVVFELIGRENCISRIQSCFSLLGD